MIEPIRFERRTFLRSLLVSAAAAAMTSPTVKALATQVIATENGVVSDAVTDAVNGLVAFIVPGPDVYSVAQGVSTTEPGGIETDIGGLLIENIDSSAPYLPNFSAVVAALLDNLALAVNPASNGAFASPFACLSYAEKVAVFQIMDGSPQLAPLAGVLTAIVPFLVYSEGSALDRESGTLRAWPVGWTISNYEGVADGRDELRGYFGNRREALSSTFEQPKGADHA
jgi:hypothetical protein